MREVLNRPIFLTKNAEIKFINHTLNGKFLKLSGGRPDAKKVQKHARDIFRFRKLANALHSEAREKKGDPEFFAR